MLGTEITEFEFAVYVLRRGRKRTADLTVFRRDSDSDYRLSRIVIESACIIL